MAGAAATGRRLGIDDGPWQQAHAAAGVAGVELRPLTSLQDADAILRVMSATWGEHQLLPREMIRALAESGNVPWGAFEGQDLVGYVLDWAAVEPENGLHVHSHMLAALPERRSRGVGLALKLAQRAQALGHGIDLVRWTFDPLLAKNAYFNIHKLGAICDRFHRDFYGDMSDSLNRGDRSDRLVVRWDLGRDPGPREGFGSGVSEVLRREGEAAAPRPVRVGDPTGTGAAIGIPRDYPELRERDRSLATAWREAVAAAIEACLAEGMVAVGFEGAGSRYVFLHVAEVPTG